LITLKNINVSYGKMLAVKNMNFHSPGGNILSIIGPNGSGKSTLLKSILGLVKPTSGEIEYFGFENTKSKFGYMPQTPSFPKNLKLSELISFLNSLETVDQINFDYLFKILDLQKYMNQKFGSLSGGTKQKVSILQCFSSSKPIYIIDEPTASLDPYISNLLKGIMIERKKQGALVIFSTHILTEVQEIADRFILISEGSLLIDQSPMKFLEKTQATNLQTALMNFWNQEYTKK